MDRVVALLSLQCVLMAGWPLLAGERPSLSPAPSARLIRADTDPLRIPLLLREVLAPPRGNAARRQRYIELLVQAGASRQELVEQPVHTQEPDSRNVIATLPGLDPIAGILVLAAHTDSMGGGDGAVDDWSGAVMLASLYQVLRQQELRHTILFAAFASEEHGCQGSAQFVRGLHRDTRAELQAMVNLECLGVGRPRTWTNRSADSLEVLCRMAGKRTGLAVKRQVLFGYKSDAQSFAHAGIPSITIHSLGPKDLGCINGPADTVDRISLYRFARTFQLLTAFLERLDQHVGPFSNHDRERHWQPAPQTLLRQAVDAGNGRGVRLNWLGSPERAAGLQLGDVLTGVAGVPVRCRGDLAPVLLTLRRGSAVDVQVCRRESGRAWTLSVSVAY